MQPDEIIQQKEWHQLTMEEKQLLAELASNRNEYNLLKKMLQVSAVETELVPTVPLGLESRLTLLMPVQKKFIHIKYWLATVAAALLIIGYFFIIKIEKNNNVVKINPIETNATMIIKAPDTVIIKNHTDTASKAIAHINKNTKPKSNKNTSLFITKKDNTPAVVINHKNTNVLTETAIKNNPELLTLTTEIY